MTRLMSTLRMKLNALGILVKVWPFMLVMMMMLLMLWLFYIYMEKEDGTKRAHAKDKKGRN